MPQLPSLLELLQAGAHFGHKTSKRHPKMEPFIFGQRNGVHIFDLEKTRTKLQEALDFLRAQVSEGKLVLFVGTKKQARDIIEKYADAAAVPYVIDRWLGGTITNFSVIRKLIDTYVGLKEKKAKGELEKYTKKEQLDFEREIARLHELVGGLERLTKVPDILYIWDIRVEETALREAKRKKIPVVAICDTNVRPDGVTHIIPANDDATKSVELITRLVSEAIQEGRAAKPVAQPQAPTSTPDPITL